MWILYTKTTLNRAILMALLIAPLFTAGIALGGIQNASAGGPITIIVDDDGEVGVVPPTSTADCDATGITADIEANIQEAIGGANPGDTIIVCPHSSAYLEAVVVDVEDITIEGIAKPKVDGTSIGSPAFTITEDGVHLTGFEAISDDDFCIRVIADDVRLLGNIANGCGNHGINVIGDDNTISGNIVNLNDGAGIVIDGDDNTIRGNKVNGNDDGNGIRIDGNDNTIQGNKVNGNDSNGIFLNIDSDRNLVKGNTVNGNDNNGIEVRGDDNTISSNTANDNGNFGFRDLGIGNDFTKNRCSGNGGGSSPGGLCKPQGNI